MFDLVQEENFLPIELCFVTYLLKNEATYSIQLIFLRILI